VGLTFLAWLGGEDGEGSGQQKSQPFEEAVEDAMGRAAQAISLGVPLEAPMGKANDLSKV
jgi:hypothetical protein